MHLRLLQQVLLRRGASSSLARGNKPWILISWCQETSSSTRTATILVHKPTYRYNHLDTTSRGGATAKTALYRTLGESGCRVHPVWRSRPWAVDVAFWPAKLPTQWYIIRFSRLDSFSLDINTTPLLHTTAVHATQLRTIKLVRPSKHGKKSKIVNSIYIFCHLYGRTPNLHVPPYPRRTAYYSNDDPHILIRVGIGYLFKGVKTPIHRHNRGRYPRLDSGRYRINRARRFFRFLPNCLPRT